MIRVILAVLCWGFPALAEPIILQSTTSTQGSGLYDHILPAFTKATNIEVRVLAVGTGQALRNAENCDADLVLVHARAAEEAFVEAGFGQARFDVMYNDFVIVGPGDDPAGVDAADQIDEALRAITMAQHRFASRGDDSGTHKAEQRLWAGAGGTPDPKEARWYLETGAGMGATLNTAVGLNAYTLTDRATWLRFANPGDFRIVFEGDPALFNQYGLITLNPNHCPNAKLDAAQAFADWILGPDGQRAIAEYRLNDQALFFPNAQP